MTIYIAIIVITLGVPTVIFDIGTFAIIYVAFIINRNTRFKNTPTNFAIGSITNDSIKVISPKTIANPNSGPKSKFAIRKFRDIILK